MRKIDWDAPLSDDDKAWLRTTGIMGINDKIAENEAQFADSSDDEDSDDYDSWTVAELKTEAAGRNPAVAVGAKDTKQNVIDALRAWDSAQNAE